jgi:hypothetical protein
MADPFARCAKWLPARRPRSAAALVSGTRRQGRSGASWVGPRGTIVKRSGQVPMYRPRSEVTSSRQAHRVQAKSVAYQGDGAQHHRCARDHWAEQGSGGWIENACRNMNRKRIEYEGEEQVLTDVAHEGSRKPPGPHQAVQATLLQGYGGALHSRVRAGAHAIPDVGGRGAAAGR